MSTPTTSTTPTTPDSTSDRSVSAGSGGAGAAANPADGEQARNTGFDVFKQVVTLLVAVAALVAFAVLIARLMNSLTIPQSEWDRAMYLYNGVEALAFAAAGFVFGKEITRERAEKAERRAAGAQEEAKAARQETKALAQDILGTAEAEEGEAETVALNTVDPALARRTAQRRLAYARLVGRAEEILRQR